MPCRPPQKVLRMDESMGLRSAEKSEEPATNNAHAAASTDEGFTNVLLIFDVNQSAQPTAQPRIGIAPLKEQRVETLVLGVTDAR